MPTAADWNRHDEAADWWQRSARLGSGGGERIRGIPSYGHEVRVRNASGADVNRYDVLGIDGILIDPATNLAEWIRAPVFMGATPEIASHSGKWAVCLEPIAAGGIRRAIVAGYTHALVDIVDATHGFCEIEDASTRLVSVATGSAKILYQESGTGEKYCIIRIGGGVGMLPQIGILLDPCAPGGIGTLKLQKQVGTALPVDRSPLETVDALNITGITMHVNVFLYVDYIEQFEVPIMFPAEIEPCFQPEGGTNVQGLE